MYRDIAEIRQFYQSPLGQMTASQLKADLESFIVSSPSSEGITIGVGYALPYLDTTKPHFAVMPAAQGVTRWPDNSPNRTLVTEDHILPFAESSISQIILIHAIENADYMRELMTESWRVLAPNGRLILVVPNRRGLWTRVDKTPFGHGRSFTMKQMRNLLSSTDFVVENHKRSLYFLPSPSSILRWLAPFFEYMGRILLPKCGGVLIVEASKRLYSVTPLIAGHKVAFPQKQWQSQAIPTT
jgi:SAM-dependent methyltransferase